MNLRRYVLYASGQLGVMLLARFLFVWILRFADQVEPRTGATAGEAAALPGVLFAPAVVGAVLLGFRLFDAVTDPLAGLMSDAWTRRGRERRQILWFTFWLAPLGLLLTFLPQHGMSEGLRWGLLFAGLFVFFVGYTVYVIPHWSLIEDYAGHDEEGRRALSTALGLGLVLANGIAMIASPVLIEAHGYSFTAGVMAVAALLLMPLPWFARPPDAPAPRRSASVRGVSVRRALAAGFRDRRFVAFLAVYCASEASLTIIAAATPFVATELLGGSDADVVKLMGPFMVTVLLTFAVVPRLSRRLGWQRAMRLAGLGLAVAYGGSAIVGRAIVGTPHTTAILLYALAGSMAAVLMGLKGEAVTDCARERGDTLVGTYFGVVSLLVKAINGLALALTGALVSLSNQPDFTTWAVRAMGLSAGAFMAVGVLAAVWIRPGGQGHRVLSDPSRG